MRRSPMGSRRRKLAAYLSLNRRADGFTIIELMIATAVFTVIMLIAAASMIYVSKTYIKGQVESQTQQTARNILETVSQDIQFNPATTINLGGGTADQTNNAYYFCIGSHVYAYVLDYELSSQIGGQYAPNDLIEYSASCPTQGPNLASVLTGKSGRELLSPHQRLGALSLECVGGIVSGACQSKTYTLTVTVAYGDDDVLSDAAQTARAQHGGLGSNNTYNYRCVNQTLGGNFCAVATLTTTIQPRIN